MKSHTKIQLKALGMLTAKILGFGGMGYFALQSISCRNGTTDNGTTTEKVCECEDKEHLGIGEDCCKTKDCTCELKVYGSFTDNSGNIVPIYRKGNITAPQMTTAVANVKEAYNERASDGDRIKLNNKLKAIYIGLEEEWGCEPVGNGQYIITFAHNISANGAANSFGYYIDNVIVYLQQREGIKLVNNLNKPAVKSAWIASEKANRNFVKTVVTNSRGFNIRKV